MIMIALRNRSGLILIIALWILGLLAFLTLNLIYRIRLGMSMSDYRQTAMESEFLLDAGLARCLWALRQDTDETADFAGEPWGKGGTLAQEGLLAPATTQNEYSVRWRISDESGKLNINLAPQKVLDLLLKNLYGTNMDHEEIASNIIDWRDEDSEGDAENDFYQSLDAPYSARNSAFKDLRELLLVRGLSSMLLQGEDANGNENLDAEEDDGSRHLPNDNEDGALQVGLSDFLTIQGEGRLNLNTAPVMVLASVFGSIAGIDESKAMTLAKLIDQNRSGKDEALGTEDDQPLRDIGEVREILKGETEINIPEQCANNLGIPLDVQSVAFQIRVYAERESPQLSSSGEGLALKSEDQITLVYWRKLR